MTTVEPAPSTGAAPRPDSLTVDPATALAATAELVPFLAAHAEEADRAGRVPEASIAALRAVGAHRMLQPRAFGGAQGSVTDHVRISAKAAEGCVAAGWCTALWSVHNWMLAHFDPVTQAEVWADPTALISGSIVPRTPFPDASARPDHVEVAGRFGFASGCDHADWLLVGGLVARDGRPSPAMVVVPHRDAAIDHSSWDVAGLRGSGSKDFVITGPLTVSRQRAMFLEDSPRRATPGQRHHAAVSLYQAPFLTVGILVLAPPALGAARAALARFVERLPTHTMRTGRPQQLDPAARLRVAESAADIDAAERTLLAAASLCDELGLRTDRDLLAEAQVARDTAYAVRLCAQAVDRLFEAAGGSALQRTEPLQRLWRDVHAIRAHAVLTWDGAANAYADALLGPTS